jgi:hypothetical protein
MLAMPMRRLLLPAVAMLVALAPMSVPCLRLAGRVAVSLAHG